MKNPKLHILDQAYNRPKRKKVTIDTVTEELIRDGCTLKKATELAPVCLKLYRVLAPLSPRAQARTMAYVEDWASDPATQAGRE